MSEIGSQKMYEDERVVVWHLDLEPGESGELHTHHRDYVVHVISGSTVEVSGPTGEVLYEVDVDSGSIVNFRIEGEELQSDRPKSPPIPRTHQARNVGTTTFREVLVEFKS